MQGKELEEKDLVDRSHSKDNKDFRIGLQDYQLTVIIVKIKIKDITMQKIIKTKTKI